MTKYIRVKDKATKHEYDIPEQKFDKAKHEPLDRKHYPPTTRPRAAKPFTDKGGSKPAEKPTETPTAS
jgi:hypothetical protein